MRRPLIALALGALAACAEPPRSSTAEPGDLPPNRRPPPIAPFTSDRALIRERVEEALERYDRDRWERLVDATDPGERFTDLRVSQEHVDQGLWRFEWLFLMGDELFEHEFSPDEGFGPGRARVHRGAVGGPDALSCAECHHRGGFDGAGDLSQNAFFDGNGYDPATGFERNAPHTLGLGPIQKLGEEMTAELQALRDSAINAARGSGRPYTVRLHAKDQSFGELTGRPDGTADTSKVSGVSEDLIVRPFGWKGGQFTIREFARDGLQRHHGMQAPDEKAIGSGPQWDPDGDHAWNEITPGMLTAMTVYLSSLEIPVMIPPRDESMLLRHANGFDLFAKSGCASCHTPSLPLHDSRLRITDKLTIDLFEDLEEPRPRRDVFETAGTPIFLFSDLRRHHMGPQLSEGRPTDTGIPGDVFLTRPLWGLADTAPYLHDGRATTLDEAILAHDGEAKDSRDAFARLTPSEKGDLRIFLMSLTRYPRIDFK